MSQEANKEKHSISDTVLKTAAGAGGGAVGGIIGLVLGGPVGAILGGAVGNAVVPAAEKFALSTRRILTQREDERTITVLSAATLSSTLADQAT